MIRRVRFIVFDRAKLQEHYLLRSRHDPWCNDESLYGPNYCEAEEIVRRRHIKDLSQYLLAVIWLKPSECYGDWRRGQEDMLSRTRLKFLAPSM